MDHTFAAAYPLHQVSRSYISCTLVSHRVSRLQGYSEPWVAPDCADAYTPMADRLSLLSNGYGFYEAFPFAPYGLCQPEPEPAPVYADMEYEPELKIARDQSRMTRFLSPGEASTPPGSPASTHAHAPSPPAASVRAEPTGPCAAAPPAMSTADARDLMETYMRCATWFEANTVEPLIGDFGVPTAALLLARPGDSAYRVFVDTKKDRKGKPMYYCCTCPFKSDRLHRVIGHQRSKRGHRPFACPDEGWYVHSQVCPRAAADPPCVLIFIVIFVDTPQRALVTIGAVGMACKPARDGMCGLISLFSSLIFNLQRRDHREEKYGPSSSSDARICVLEPNYPLSILKVPCLFP